MNLTFRDEVFKAGFRPSLEVEDFEISLRGKLGLKAKYESARLCIGRSLAQPSMPEPAPASEEKGKTISGEMLFGNELDLWIAAVVMDGDLGPHASLEHFRNLVEAHWIRGGRLLRDELASVDGDETRLIVSLAALLPAEVRSVPPTAGGFPTGRAGEIRLLVGSVSKTFPDGQGLDFCLNGQGTAPHMALMGKVGSGKTTTGVQIARQIAERACVPFFFIDPKGESVDGGRLIGPLSEFVPFPEPIEIGQRPIPLDFLPDPGVGSASITQAAMQIRDSIALCCKSVGNVQQDLLRTAVEDVIRSDRSRDLIAVRARYESRLTQAGKPPDSVVSRLNELTALRVFVPEMPAHEFFQRSWVLSLKAVASEELKRLTILLILDALKGFILSQPDSPVEGGFRTLRHLLVVDEARRILMQQRYQSLVDLVRQGRSKGEVVILLSQDPSDFAAYAELRISDIMRTGELCGPRDRAVMRSAENPAAWATSGGRIRSA